MYSRYPRLLILAGASLLFVFSCTKKDDYTQKSIEDVTGSVPSLFSIDSYTFDPQGSSDDFAYVSELGWTLSERPEWVVVQPQSGNEGRTVISIRADLNSQWEDRSGTLSFKDKNGTTHSIQVSQDCPKLGCSVRSLVSDLEPSSGSVPEKGAPEGRFDIPFLWSHASGETEPVEVSITSNVNWQIQLTNEEWFGLFEEKDGTAVSSISGTGDKVIYVNALKHNFSKEDISDAILTVVSYTNDSYAIPISESAVAKWSMDLSQTHLKFLLGKSSSDADMTHDDFGIDFDELGYVKGKTSYEQSLYVDCELPWTVSVNGFVKLNSEDNGLANVTEYRQVFIKHPETNAKINFTKAEKTEDIVFSAIKDGNVVASRKITVHQDPYVFSIDKDNYNLENGVFLEDGSRKYTLQDDDSPRMYTIALTTTGEWKVEDLTDEEKEWLEIDPATISGGEDRNNPVHNIRFWVKKQNLEFDDIIAHINLRANYGWVTENGITDLQIKSDVSQKQFVFSGGLEDASSLSATQLYEDGVTKDISIASSGPWSLCVNDGGVMTPVSGSDACYLSVSSDTGFADAQTETGTTVQVGAKMPNEGNEDRVTKIYLLSVLHEALPADARKGYTPIEIPITQRRFTFAINGTESDSSQGISAYKQSFNDAFTVESDGNWEIVAAPEWLHPYPMSALIGEGNLNKTVLLTPDVYGNLDEPRSGDVKLRCYYKEIERNLTLTVTQEKLVFSVSSVSDTGFGPACNYPYGGSYFNPASWDYTLEATEELPWTLVIDSGNMSLSGSRPSKMTGSGSQSGSLYPDYNQWQESRSMTFHFETTDSRFPTAVKSQSFMFTQGPYIWDDSPLDAVTFDALSSLVSGQSRVSFMCSGPWEFRSSPSWMDVGGISFTSDPDFTVKVSPNTSTANTPRSATVTIYSLIGSYSKSFELNQWQYYFDSTPVNLSFTTLDATDQAVSFQCSGSWMVANATGVSVDQASGSGSVSGGTLSLKFHPDDYFDENNDRSAYFIIRSSDNSSFTKRVNYLQPKYYFNVSASSIDASGPKDTGAKEVTVTITPGDTWSFVNSNTSAVTASRSGDKLILTPQVNYTQSARNATITLESSRGKKTRTLAFNQPAYRFSLSSDTVSMKEAGETKSVTVTSDGNWTITKDATADWLTLNVTSGGVGATEVRLTAASNVGNKNSDRTVTLTLKGSDHESLVKTITVSQKAATQ